MRGFVETKQQKIKALMSKLLMHKHSEDEQENEEIVKKRFHLGQHICVVGSCSAAADDENGEKVESFNGSRKRITRGNLKGKGKRGGLRKKSMIDGGDDECGDLGEKDEGFVQENGNVGGDFGGKGVGKDLEKKSSDFVDSEGQDFEKMGGCGDQDIRDETEVSERSGKQKKVNYEESTKLRRRCRENVRSFKNAFNEELDEFFPGGDCLTKRRKKSSADKDGEKNCRSRLRGQNNKEIDTSKDGLTSLEGGAVRKRRDLKDDNGDPLSVMCHQCQRNDKGRVVTCGNCKWKRFCVPCMTKWYPTMTEDDFARSCPVCQFNCNCIRCLRMEVPEKDKERFNLMLRFTDEEKIQSSKYIVSMLLPFLKQFNEEQMREKQIEAQVRGLSLSELEVEKAKCGLGERMHCDNCISYETSGEDCHPKSTLCIQVETSNKDHSRSTSQWKPLKDGNIPCPPNTLGGCGKGILKLMCLCGNDYVLKLLASAEELSSKYKLIPETPGQRCSCFNSVSEIGTNKLKSLKTASREDCSDNYLWCEVDVNSRQFFNGYVEGRGDSVTKLHCDMTDVVNVLTHIQEVTLTSDQQASIEKLKQKHIAQDKREIFGSEQMVNNKVEKQKVEFSVTKGALNKHIPRTRSRSKEDLGSKREAASMTGISITRKGNVMDQMLEKQHDMTEKKSTELGEHAGNIDVGTWDNNIEGIEHPGGGAIWDIFRRQDSPKLEEYLRKNFREFRHVNCRPLDQVVHPIHDRTFYLTLDHKRRLKEEYGIEPWTFVQKQGDAVYIPAGCPNQVRNIQSCIKVSMGFVSPENVSEGIRLAEEIRVLPQNHSAKVDNLEIKKLILNAIAQAARDLEKLPVKRMRDFGTAIYRRKKAANAPAVNDDNAVVALYPKNLEDNFQSCKSYNSSSKVAGQSLESDTQSVPSTSDKVVQDCILGSSEMEDVPSEKDGKEVHSSDKTTTSKIDSVKQFVEVVSYTMSSEIDRLKARNQVIDSEIATYSAEADALQKASAAQSLKIANLDVAGGLTESTLQRSLDELTIMENEWRKRVDMLDF
ncbi:hypothetical protein POM88_020509 [Heracleum sosnowskyi]|uniref:Uncharacterized protein n=1 Tax=Heracleum sosnowskyi TaxID=360622 RepID=A0AAD8MS11_9APIA|nr:hypothetical protein POM88_020509 [Heracleum sosnowskyi]